MHNIISLGRVLRTAFLLVLSGALTSFPLSGEEVIDSATLKVTLIVEHPFITEGTPVGTYEGYVIDKDESTIYVIAN